MQRTKAAGDIEGYWPSLNGNIVNAIAYIGNAIANSKSLVLMIHTLLTRYRQNYAFLHRVADGIGREFESKSYDELCNPPGEALEDERVVDGVRVSFSAYSYNFNRKNGDLYFCVDIRSKLPTFLGGKPYYQFVKRPDGSVYY